LRGLKNSAWWSRLSRLLLGPSFPAVYGVGTSSAGVSRQEEHIFMKHKRLILGSVLALSLAFAGTRLQAQGTNESDRQAQAAPLAQLPCPQVGTPEAATALCVSIPISTNAIGQGAAAYGPNPLSIGLGTTVIWVNDDTNPHTITAGDSSFDSSTLTPGQSYAHTFNEPGVIPYYDTIYGQQSMSGVISVATAPNLTPPSAPPVYGANCVNPAYPYPNFPYPHPTQPPRPYPSPSASVSPAPSPSVSPSPYPSPYVSPSPYPSASVSPGPYPYPFPYNSGRP
jgi:plastocyanin